MNRDLLDTWLERGILGISLAILVLLPLVFGGRPQPATGLTLDFLMVEPFLIAEWLTVVVMLLWLCRIWLNPKTRLLFPPVCWAVLAFTVYAVARWLTSDIEYVARQETIKVVVYACLFFVILNNLHRQETTQIVSFTLIFLAMALSFYAIYQFVAGSDRVWHLLKHYHHRGSGTFISPNHLAGFLEMILPLGLAYTLLGRFKVLTKVFLGYATLVILVGLVVTMSRGAWLATAFSIICLFAVLMMHQPYRLPSMIALGVLLGAGVLLLPTSKAFKARIHQVYSGGKLDDDARFALWQPALRVWELNRWFGVGPAHFDYRFAAYRPEQVQARPDRAHNDFLNTLADLGIVGTALVASAWVLLGWGAFKTWGRVRKTPRDIGGSTNSSKTAFVLGSVIGLLAVLIHSAVDFNMHIPANAALAVALMALLSSHLRFATDNFWLTARPFIKVAVTVVVLVAAGFLFLQARQRTAESIWLARAAAAPVYAEKHLAGLKAAAAIEPNNSETARGIGEALKYLSAQGTENYLAQATEAAQWFEKAMKLNPWDTTAPLLCGWCLDWLGRHDEAGSYFDRAEKLDPNSYFTMAQIGVHYIQRGDLAAARPWLERSLRLEQAENPIAKSYLALVNRRLAEDAARRFGTN